MLIYAGIVGFPRAPEPLLFQFQRGPGVGVGDLGSEYSVSLMFSVPILPSLPASASQRHPTTLPPHYHGFPLLRSPFYMLTCISSTSPWLFALNIKVLS